MDLRRRLVGPHHRLGHTALADRGCIDVRAIGDGIGDAFIQPRFLQHDIRA